MQIKDLCTIDLYCSKRYQSTIAIAAVLQLARFHYPLTLVALLVISTEDVHRLEGGHAAREEMTSCALGLAKVGEEDGLLAGGAGIHREVVGHGKAGSIAR